MIPRTLQTLVHYVLNTYMYMYLPAHYVSVLIHKVPQALYYYYIIIVIIYYRMYMYTVFGQHTLDESAVHTYNVHVATLIGDKINGECKYLVFAIRVEVVEVGGVPAGHVMQEERGREIRNQKSSGEIVRQRHTKLIVKS